MPRSRLLWFRHLIGALVVLAGVLCAVEGGFRIYDSYTGGALRNDRADLGPVARSWFTHHGLKPLQRSVEPEPDDGEPVEIVTSSFGLRGPDVAVPKPPGVYRILCLGDETTFAPDIAEAETFCTRLGELLQPHARLRIEVVNAGVPGYCPLLSYLQLKHGLLALQPDLIVLGLDMTDVADDHGYRPFVRVDPSGVPLACPHPDLTTPTRAASGDLTESVLLARWAKQELARLTGSGDGGDDQRDIDAPQGRYAWLKDNPPEWSVYIRQALEPIVPLHRTADHVYARLVVVSCPAPWQVSETAAAEARPDAGVPLDTVYRSRGPFDVIGSFLHARGIPHCDLSPGFQQAPQPDRLYRRRVPRLSPEGHDLYARLLTDFLLRTVPGVWNEPTPYTPQPPARQAANEPWGRPAR